MTLILPWVYLFKQFSLWITVVWACFGIQFHNTTLWWQSDVWKAEKSSDAMLLTWCICLASVRKGVMIEQGLSRPWKWM